MRPPEEHARARCARRLPLHVREHTPPLARLGPVPALISVAGVAQALVPSAEDPPLPSSGVNSSAIQALFSSVLSRRKEVANDGDQSDSTWATPFLWHCPRAPGRSLPVPPQRLGPPSSEGPCGSTRTL